MAEQDLDRSHAATPYKLEKARERGQVPKSPDAVAAAVLLSAMVFLTWHGWETWREVFRLGHALVLPAGRMDASPRAIWALVERFVVGAGLLSAPFFGTLLVAAVVGNLIQTGPVLSVEPLKPDWDRVNPVAGLKRIFTPRTLVQAVRALLKLALLGAVAWVALRGIAPQLRGVGAYSPVGHVRALLDALAAVGLRLTLTLGLIALLDVVYTRHEFAKQMRMSQRELKDEVKHREGDPRIRAHLRELRRELLKRSLAVRKTRAADVLVTNPTHFAVALKYVHGEMEAPQLLAKGAGRLAAVMREIAARHNVPIVVNPPLARALFREAPVDGSVPPDLYAPVARIVVWVLAMRDARRRSAGGASTRAPGRPAWSS